MKQPDPRPPRLAEWLLSRVTDKSISYSALGDLSEHFQALAEEDGVARARRWYWLQAIKSIPYFLGDLMYWRAAMLKNYLTVAFRDMRKHRGDAFVNIFGLGLGMACCILILAYVKDDLSYDRFYQKADRINRLVDDLSGDGVTTAAVPNEWGPAIKQQLPEVEDVVRLRTLDRFKPLISHNEKRFYEDAVWWVDSTFFRLFDFEFVQGSAEDALSAPDAVVIVEETAQKYFGGSIALGKTVTFNNEETLRITGVIRRPLNTHLKFDFLRRLSALRPGLWTRTYLLLKEGASPENTRQKLAFFLKNQFGDQHSRSFRFTPQFQALSDIYLHSNVRYELGPNGNIAYIYILMTTAVMVLGVACINFVNLANARSMNRVLEVGVRKTLGAYPKQLAAQFLGGSLLTSLMALLVAAIIVEIVLPNFNAMTGKRLLPVYREDMMGFLGTMGTFPVVGLLAGLYPALFLSSLKPTRILKGKFSYRFRGGKLRQLLVVAQFAVSIGLLIGTGVIHGQLDYVREKRLGFDKEHVLAIASRDPELNRRYKSVKSELMQNQEVIKISFMQSLPGDRITTFGYTVPGLFEERVNMTAFASDYDIIKTLGLEIIAGRDFSEEFVTDSAAFILNEAAVRALGLENPIGREFGVDYLNKMGTIVGIVKNFHFASLHQPIEPAVLQVMPPGFYAAMAVRVRGGNISETLVFLEKKWNQFAPDYPFQFRFLDDAFATLYRNEERLGQLFEYFSGLAILVACLGLLGLSYFSTQQRTKEISVRKILGATDIGIICLLISDLTKLVAIAFIIAAPLGYLSMSQWLQNFAYRIEPNIGIFIISGLITLILSWLTVAYNTIKTARLNPADSLRNE